MPSQRPYFLSSFLAAFRQQPPNIASSTGQQHNKHHGTQSASVSATAASAANQATGAASSSNHHRSTSSSSASAAPISTTPRANPASASVTIHSPRSGGAGSIAVPQGSSSRRRGSDSSSEGFRDVIGADKWYIGGRTAGGEERFFKLGVVRRVRSNDGLSLDRLSL